MKEEKPEVIMRELYDSAIRAGFSRAEAMSHMKEMVVGSHDALEEYLAKLEAEEAEAKPKPRKK